MDIALIRELNGEHSRLKKTLDAIAARGVFDGEARKSLAETKELFIAHLDKENRALYPALNRAAERSESLKGALRVMNKEIDALSVKVSETLENWSALEDATPIPDGFDTFYAILMDRFHREERVLYAKYARLPEPQASEKKEESPPRGPLSRLAAGIHLPKEFKLSERA